MTNGSVKRGFLRSAMDGFVAARQREANRYVARTLSMLDDDTLKLYGFTRKDLK